jgi:MraZ protein
VLRGNIPARIDDKGRLKIPNTFRALISEAHGREVFVTSLTGESVRVYPMPVWLEIEQKLAQAPSTLPARLKFLDRVNYYGQVGEFDAQGRLLIQPRLRASALMNGDVAVIGQLTYFEVWNDERFQARLRHAPLTDDDMNALAGFGI